MCYLPCWASSWANRSRSDLSWSVGVRGMIESWIDEIRGELSRSWHSGKLKLVSSRLIRVRDHEIRAWTRRVRATRCPHQRRRCSRRCFRRIFFIYWAKYKDNTYKNKSVKKPTRRFECVVMQRRWWRDQRCWCYRPTRICVYQIRGQNSH